MKHWISAIVGLACVSSVFANNCPFTGTYVGANFGLIQNDIHHQGTETIFISPITTLNASTNALHKTHSSLLGGLTLGYALPFQQFLVGIEGRANYQRINSNSSEKYEINTTGTDAFDVPLTKNANIKMQQDFAILAKLGFIPNDLVLLYGLIGIDWGKISVSTNSTMPSLFAGSNVDFMFPSASQSNYEAGLALGLGMEYLFIPCASLGLEYDYANYGSIDYPTVAASATNNATGSAQINTTFNDVNSIKMKTNKVLIKVNYYFG